MPTRQLLILALTTVCAAQAQTKSPDWAKINDEAMRHFQARFK